MSNLNNNNLYQPTMTAAERAVQMRKAFSMVGIFTLMLIMFVVGSYVPLNDSMTWMVSPIFIALYIVAVRRLMAFGDIDVLSQG